MGAWAAGALREAVRAAGLAPAELDALKPVLVNSAHVAERDEGAFGARLLSLKEQAIEHRSGERWKPRLSKASRGSTAPSR